MIERKLCSHLRALLFVLLAGVFSVQALQADEVMRQVQEELRKRHLYFGDVDGRFTPEVAAALRRYQERKGFSPSGTADETTLRSLTLIPPGPTNLSVAPLPDITVLRSDAGVFPHQANEAGAFTFEDVADLAAATPGSVPAPTPTPAPAPASAAVQRPDAAAVRAFIESYLKAGQTNDLAGEMRFYGDHVDYFEDGVRDQQFIERDVRRFQNRWPERQFTLSSPVTIGSAPDADPAKIDVHFRYRFAEKGSHYSAAGQADTEYVLAGTRPEDLRIISMKEQRVRP